jgi:hypothetical protein
MLLGAWRTSRLVYRFDREAGHYQRRLVRLGVSLPTSGFGAIERTREHGKMFFGLYRWDGRMVFQAGKRRWHLDRTDLKIAYRPLPGGRSSELTVHEAGALAFRCSYRHWLRSIFPRRDTADDDTVDLERNHFLAHVAGQSLPMRDLEAWTDGKVAEEELAAERATPTGAPG